MKKHILFFLKFIVAIIMLQTLFYKFSGAQESVELFTKIAGKNEILMRITIGVLELIAAILLFVPKKTWLGAVLTLVLMSGAIFSHLTKLGIEHNGDNGALFYGAVITFIFSGILLVFHRKNLPFNISSEEFLHSY